MNKVPVIVHKLMLVYKRYVYLMLLILFFKFYFTVVIMLLNTKYFYKIHLYEIYANKNFIINIYSCITSVYEFKNEVHIITKTIIFLITLFIPT